MKHEPDFSRRATDLEIMDDLGCSGEVVEQTLRELEFINRWLGGNRITLRAVRKLFADGLKREDAPIRIADLGCGSGDILMRIAAHGRRSRIPMQLTGIDANPHIIEIARRKCAAYPEIKFQALDVFGADYQCMEFDVIIGTLFFHHFTDEALVQLLGVIRKQARLGFIINDLHRHWLAYHAIRLLTRFFSRSSMVKYDAPLSVRRAFTRREVEGLLAVSYTHLTLPTNREV